MSEEGSVRAEGNKYARGEISIQKPYAVNIYIHIPNKSLVRES
jgi:hypothetical protein